MKRKTPLTLAVLWLLAGFSLRAGEVGAPQEVALNGIAVFGGQRYAALVIDQQVTSAGRGFVLAEGDDQNGVRLLAVDAVRQTVEIENGGQRQMLHLHGSPDVAAKLAIVQAAMAAAQTPEGYTNGLQKVAVNTALLPGNPGYGTIPWYPPAARQSSSTAVGSATSPGPVPVSLPSTGASANSGSATVLNMPGSSSTSGGSLSAGNPVLQPGSAPGAATGTGTSSQGLPQWYLDSQYIESQRIATEQQVISGELAPLPRTPLTPVGTPDGLVDNLNGVYSNYNTDFLTQNWSQM